MFSLSSSIRSATLISASCSGARPASARPASCRASSFCRCSTVCVTSRSKNEQHRPGAVGLLQGRDVEVDEAIAAADQAGGDERRAPGAGLALSGADGQGGVKRAELGAEQLRRAEGLVKAAADDAVSSPPHQAWKVGLAQRILRSKSTRAMPSGTAVRMRCASRRRAIPEASGWRGCSERRRSAPCRATPGRRRWNRPARPRPRASGAATQQPSRRLRQPPGYEVGPTRRRGPRGGWGSPGAR